MRALARGQNVEVVSTFDYSLVDRATASEARALAERVRNHERRITQEVIDLGGALSRMKERLGHGNFLPWIEAEFGDKARTAQRYMQAAEAFAGKSDTMSYLPPTVLYALAAPSTPEAVRSEIVEKIEAGERPEPRAIRAKVKTATKAARELERVAKLSPEERKRVGSLAKRKRTLAAKREDERETGARREYEEQVAHIEAALRVVDLIIPAPGPIQAEVRRLIGQDNYDLDRLVMQELRERLTGASGRETLIERRKRLGVLLARPKVRPQADERWGGYPFEARR